MSEIRVLVVDDHDLFRTGLSSLLAAERGLDNEAIAAALDISPRTARDHVASILRGLDPRRRGPEDGPEGSSGVREPRRPLAQTGGGSAQVQPPTQ